jgi:hypothetical protein
MRHVAAALMLLGTDHPTKDQALGASFYDDKFVELTAAGTPGTGETKRRSRTASTPVRTTRG